LGPVAVFDALVEAPVVPGLSVFAAGENLLDRRYTVARTPLTNLGYPRAWGGGLRLRLGCGVGFASKMGKGRFMPDKGTLELGEEDKGEGKSPSTQAGEFVREEMHHVREGKHGARSTKQAIAIGLSKARRAGVGLGAPKGGTASKETRRKA